MSWLEWVVRDHLINMFTVCDGPTVEEGDTVIFVRCNLVGSHHECPTIIDRRLGHPPKPLHDVVGTPAVTPTDPAHQ
jgi:hypothetical protein